ncbi:MAG: outer membrane lipoprotein chaperone LolA [Methylococcales bacterium]|nr:outer membrane lipoprotein chaperone LolA [Methylococcales bacterium]
MFKKIVSNLSIILFLTFFNSANAEQTPIEQLKSFLASTSSLTADFKQVTLDENEQPTQTSYGEFFLSRPGKFRWSYKKPFIQEIVSSKNKVWFYDADLEQVTIKKMDESLGSTPALLLSGDIDLEENYTLQQQGIDEDLQWIKLSPKNEESSFNYILIGLTDGVLGGMELSDNFGQLTRIYFSNIKRNLQLDNAIFEFIAPEGVDVFEN